MTVPPIFLYTTDDPAAPAHLRACAAMDQSGPGMHWISFGATGEEAADKLRAFWLKAEAKKPRKPPRKSPEAAAASDIAPDDDEVII